MKKFFKVKKYHFDLIKDWITIFEDVQIFENVCFIKFIGYKGRIWNIRPRKQIICWGRIRRALHMITGRKLFIFFSTKLNYFQYDYKLIMPEFHTVTFLKKNFFWAIKSSEPHIAQKNNELTVTENSIATVIKKQTSGWWQVKVGSNIGLLPASILKLSEI